MLSTFIAKSPMDFLIELGNGTSSEGSENWNLLEIHAVAVHPTH